ncbi:hypothetical protein TNCV_4385321 [Trichonephila clavipes]|nr:hypothetical protein TNCV_4385321 [Trichonephila clavipes]
MSSFLVLCEGDTRNRWRDGQVCPDVRQGTMAPWTRRLGGEKKRRARKESGRENGRKEEKRRKRREREGSRENGRKKREDERRRKRRERERSPPCMEKRAESGIGVKKTMNAGGVENGI